MGRPPRLFSIESVRARLAGLERDAQHGRRRLAQSTQPPEEDGKAARLLGGELQAAQTLADR